MRHGWLILGLLLWLPMAVGAKPRTLYLVVPVPQERFPPAWTETIHLSLKDAPNPIQDHRHWKKGESELRAALSGRIANQVYEVEVLCLSKGEKQIAVFRQSIRVKPETRKLTLDRLKFVEWLKNP